MFPMHGPRNSRMPHHYMGPNFRNHPGSPFMGAPPPMRQRKGPGGGLLSKLLGNKLNKSQNQAYRAFGPAATQGGGSFIKSLTNPSTLNSFLTNTQKVLSTAQQVGPIVQQYGPIVKNLPTMWKLYRGLKNAPEFNEDRPAENDTDGNVVKHSNEEVSNSVVENENEENKRTNRRSPSPSRPRLYI